MIGNRGIGWFWTDILTSLDGFVKISQYFISHLAESTVFRRRQECIRPSHCVSLQQNVEKSCWIQIWWATWEFSQLSLLGQTRTRVAWELTSESLHERFLNLHCLIKQEQELHESWQARIYIRVFSTFIVWSDKNKSCMRVDKREFTWEFLNFHCLIKREQELHESWQARVYMRVS